ncbi:MAG: response regulator transcription factor [Firmicutes bacterium]|jgi:DNA-binding response OmpR family regulator|nr:response regulator transcription factor [Bacillota bacterium]
MDKERILVADDDKEIRELIKIYLTSEGFEPVLAKDGLEALEIINKGNIDLAVLDVMMPKLTGIDICMEVRKDNNIPIIIVSAKSQDSDKILGLTTGADDYLTKPFNPLELIARIKSQLRRYKKLNDMGDSSASVISVENLVIDKNSHEVSLDGRILKLTPREFDILLLLAQNRGIVFSTEKIYEQVWQEEYFDSKNTVVVHMRKLREKIEEDPRNPVFIKTVWGVGYKFEK